MASSKKEDKLNIPAESFNTLAKTYANKGQMGPQNRICEEILKHAPQISSESVIHDNACGAAAVASSILALGVFPPPEIFATDYAQGMVDASNSLKESNGWDTVTVLQMDGQNLTFEDNKFTHSISSFGVFMFPDYMKGLQEMHRTLKPGGWIGITTWKDVRWPTAARAAYAKMFLGSKEPMVFPEAPGWSDPELCAQRLTEAGFRDVQTKVFESSNKKPSLEAGCSHFSGFIRVFSPTAKGWDEETWEKYTKYFNEEMGPMWMSDGDGFSLTTYVILTSGTKM